MENRIGAYGLPITRKQYDPADILSIDVKASEEIKTRLN